MITLTKDPFANVPPNFMGLSTDEKPTSGVQNGSGFTEMDTGDKYVFNAESGEWLKSKSGDSGGSAVPVEVSTEADMTALLTSGEAGGVYKYTGETTEAYENGALYVLEGDSLVKLIDQTALPQLYAPTITLDGDTLTITANADNGAFATSYDLYIDGSLVGNYTSTTIDLTTLELAEGTYSITAKAMGTIFADSADSVAVSYTVESVDYTTELVGTWTLNPTDLDFSMISGSHAIENCNITGVSEDGSSSVTYNAIGIKVGQFGIFVDNYSSGLNFVASYPRIYKASDGLSISTSSNNRWTTFSTFTINSVTSTDTDALAGIYAFLQANATKQ